MYHGYAISVSAEPHCKLLSYSDNPIHVFRNRYKFGPLKIVYWAAIEMVHN